MKTEDFDDAIRRKVESVYFNPKQGDIDLIYQHVNGNVTSSFFKNFGVLTFSGITLLIIGGLITWNIIQYRQNSSLVSRIDQLNKTVIENSVITNKAIKAQAELANVMQKKYNDAIGAATTYEHNSNYQELSATPNPSPYYANTSNANLNSISNNHKSNTPLAVIDHHGNPATSENNQHTIVADAAKETVSNNTSSKNANNISNVGSSNLNDGNYQDKNLNTTTKENTVLKDNASAANNKAIANQTSNVDSIHEKENNNVANNLKSNENKLYNRPTSKKSLFSGYSLKNLHYMAGLGAEMATKQNGFGINAQVSFSDRWSIGLGLKALMVNNELYPDGDDFQSKKGVNFHKVYMPNDPDSGKINNIHTNNQLIQIPLAINYTIPLRKNYGLLFSAGTDIDIYANQRIEYATINSSGFIDFYHKNISVPALTLNNAVFSAGVQKRWGHLVAQLSPYICPQITSVVYKKEDLYAGMRFRLFYAFGI